MRDASPHCFTSFVRWLHVSFKHCGHVDGLGNSLGLNGCVALDYAHCSCSSRNLSLRFQVGQACPVTLSEWAAADGRPVRPSLSPPGDLWVVDEPVEIKRMGDSIFVFVFTDLPTLQLLINDPRSYPWEKKCSASDLVELTRRKLLCDFTMPQCGAPCVAFSQGWYQEMVGARVWRLFATRVHAGARFCFSFADN